MGLIKDIVKAGAYGLIGGAVAKGVIREIKKTPEERENEKVAGYETSYSFSVLSKNITEIFEALKQILSSKGKLTEETPNEKLVFIKGSNFKSNKVWTIVNLKKVGKGVLVNLSCKGSSTWGAPFQVSDIKQFKEDCRNLEENLRAII